MWQPRVANTLAPDEIADTAGFACATIQLTGDIETPGESKGALPTGLDSEEPRCAPRVVRNHAWRLRLRLTTLRAPRASRVRRVSSRLKSSEYRPPRARASGRSESRTRCCASEPSRVRRFYDHEHDFS